MAVTFLFVQLAPKSRIPLTDAPMGSKVLSGESPPPGSRPGECEPTHVPSTLFSLRLPLAAAVCSDGSFHGIESDGRHRSGLHSRCDRVQVTGRQPPFHRPTRRGVRGPWRSTRRGGRRGVMSWAGKGRFACSLSMIARWAPAQSGVYVVFAVHNWISVGESADIGASLRRACSGNDPGFRQHRPTHFAFELVPAARRVARRDALIQEFRPTRNQGGKATRAHKRAPSSRSDGRKQCGGSRSE